MNRFNKEEKKTHLLRRVLTSAAIFGCGAFILVRGVSSISETADKNQTDSLRLAITRSAVHCYAMEGRYPESLDNLKTYYGISWDPDKYVVDYEVTGSNLMPTVTIIPLVKEEG